MSVVVKRWGRSPGQVVEYCYETIGSQPVNEYFRDKMREYRRRMAKDKAPKDNPVGWLSATDKELVNKLYREGWSQQKLADRFRCSRYRIENALGLR